MDEFIKDHKGWQEKALNPEKRDRILAALEVEKQSALYKRIKSVLDQMLHGKLPIDSLVEPLEDDIDTREKLSELGGEVLSDLPTGLRVSELPSESLPKSPSASPLEEPTGDFSESTDELLSESLTHMEMAKRLGTPTSTLSARKNPLKQLDTERHCIDELPR